MNPTEKEKDRREYKLELARLALAKGAKRDSDARQFKALQWREEARTAAKRRIIEDGRRDEIVKRKKLAVEAVENDGSEAEADEEEQQETTAEIEIVQIPDPKAVLNEGNRCAHIFAISIFIYFLFVNIIYNSKIRKYVFS